MLKSQCTSMSKQDSWSHRQGPLFIGLKLAVSAGLLLVLVAWPSLAIPPEGPPAGGGNEAPPPTGSYYGDGMWINIAPAEACGGPTSSRVCAEFVDKNAGSPYTGKICCVDSMLISQCRFSDCALLLKGPREEEEEEDGE